MTIRPVALAVAFTSFVVPASAQDPVKPYGPGQGASYPVVVHEEKPRYTSQALRAKIYGIVEVEAVIAPDGQVTGAKVRKSLDPLFGLDDEALRAARAWRFKPAVKDGKAVPFIVIIQLEFRLDPQAIADADFEQGAYAARTPGLVLPKVRHEEKPKYSSEAMRRKIQGIVELQAVVGVDGKVDRVRVVKSLDKEYGLDEEALRTALAWTFDPGTLNGAPVPVLVLIQLEFRVGK